MEPTNPYRPPMADLEGPEIEPEGPVVPWEDPARFPALATRAIATFGILLRPSEAGSAIGSGRRLGPPLTFYAAVGFPLLWLAQILAALLRAGASPPWMGHFGLPQAPAPSPEAMGLQRTIALVGALAAPISMAFSLAITGAVTHAGLWMTRGLRAGKGIEVTYRCVLYAHGAIGLVSSLFALWPFLPLWPATLLFAAMILFWIGAAAYQGVLLAKAHGTETWRGVLGVFLPWIIVSCCCACLGIGVAAATGAFKGNFR